jgi:hypothetical protein
MCCWRIGGTRVEVEVANACCCCGGECKECEGAPGECAEGWGHGGCKLECTSVLDPWFRDKVSLIRRLIGPLFASHKITSTNHYVRIFSILPSTCLYYLKINGSYV